MKQTQNKDPAAVALGRRGGHAGKGKPKSQEHRDKLADNLKKARERRWPKERNETEVTE